MSAHNLDNRVIVITGASSGIGAAFARLAIARGAKVVLAARREAELATLAKELGERAVPVAMDITLRADTERLRDRAIAAFGHIDTWIANAGRGISRPVLALRDEDLDEMMAINVKPLVHTAQAVVPHWKERGHGHLIYVSSGLARLPLATIRAAYSASKAAATALVSALRLELRVTHPNILASTVFPGVVATGFGANALHGGPDSRALPGAQPVDEVAGVIADLVVTRHAEVYTRPQLGELTARYYAAPDVAVIEGQPPFTMQPR